MPFLDATIRPSPVDPRFAMTVPVDESGRTEAMSEIPDLQHEAYKYGVIGKTVQDVGKAAQQLHLGYAQGKLQGQIQNITTPIQDSLLQISQLETDIDGLQRQKRMATSIEDIKRIEPDLHNKLNLLREAQSQGAINSKDYMLRVSKAIREAVNRNPGYTNPLIEHGRDVLWSAGIREIQDPYIDIDKANQKAEKDKRTLLTTQATKYGVPVDPFRIHEPEYQQQLVTQYTVAAEAKNYATAVVRGEKLDKIANKTAREENSIKFKQGGRLLIDDLINTHAEMLLNTTDKKTITQSELTINSQIEDGLNTSYSNLISSGYTAEEANRHIAELRSYATRQKTALKDLKSGKINKEQFDAASSWMKIQNGAFDQLGFSADFRKIAEKHTPQTLAALAKNDPNMAHNVMTYQKLRAGLLDPSVKKMLIENVSAFGNQPAAIHYLKTYLESGDPALISDVMSSFNKVYKNDSYIMDNTDKVLFRDKYISTLASLTPDAHKFLPSNIKEATKEILSSQLNDVMNYVFPAKENWDIQAYVTSTGEFNATVFNQGTNKINDNETAKFRNSISARVNEIIKANAAISGISMQQSSNEVLQDFAPQLGITLPQLPDENMNTIDKIIGKESGGNPLAKNPRSSAGGLGQFIDSTWLTMIKKYAPEIAEGKSKDELLALKTNPELSKQMLEHLTNENKTALEAKQLPINDSTLYLAHFLGSDKAVKLLQSNYFTPIEKVVSPEVLKANPQLKGKNVGQVIAWADNLMQ